MDAELTGKNRVHPIVLSAPKTTPGRVRDPSIADGLPRREKPRASSKWSKSNTAPKKGARPARQGPGFLGRCGTATMGHGKQPEVPVL